MTEQPLVSVVSITYNHEPYIREALDGFVQQRTDFPVEVVIADDASTDATPAIIRSYADRHPHLFRPILRDRNVGIHANLSGALSAARGEFIALCEGDDYWTDPRKLAKQVSHLRENPGLGLSFHPVRVTWMDGSAGDSEVPAAKWRRDISVDALVNYNFVQTNSVMYRRLDRYDDIPSDIMPIDWYLHVRHALRGGVAMLPDTMAVYRRHAEGVWYSADTDHEKFWRKHGFGQAALLDELLALCEGHRKRRLRILGSANWLLNQLATVPGTDGRDLILETVARRPRLFQHHPAQRVLVQAALLNQRSHTARRWLKSALTNRRSSSP